MIVEPRTRAGRAHAHIDAEKDEREKLPGYIKDIFGTFVYGDDHENRETIKDIASEPGTVCFEAEVVNPKSGRYRTVWVYVPQEQVLALLKLCRHAAAAAQREQAMS